MLNNGVCIYNALGKCALRNVPKSPSPARVECRSCLPLLHNNNCLTLPAHGVVSHCPCASMCMCAQHNVPKSPSSARAECRSCLSFGERTTPSDHAEN